MHYDVYAIRWQRWSSVGKDVTWGLEQTYEMIAEPGECRLDYVICNIGGRRYDYIQPACSDL